MRLTIPSSEHLEHPHYLTSSKAALFLPEDDFIKARSIELYGLPGKTDWVAKLNPKIVHGIVKSKVTDLVAKLNWRSSMAQALKNTAWAEHLVAYQNPRIWREMQIQAQEEENIDKINAPSWPPTPASLDKPSARLSWSIADDRDESRYGSPAPPAFTNGKHTFPRPQRILRLRLIDPSLVVVLATPAARRAVLTAYSDWIRCELREAYLKLRAAGSELDLGSGGNVWPPVSRSEVGNVNKGNEDRLEVDAAVEWARRVGWRPAFRIQPFRGTRQYKDAWHPRGKWGF